MPLIKPRPTSPGIRHQVRVRTEGLYRGRPEPSLVTKKKRISGRANSGHISVRHRGGGARRLYRVIDFRRAKDGVPARVERVEYDPNRSANIALLLYRDGERRYIIHPDGAPPGSELLSGEDVPIRPGNCLPLAGIPDGTQVHCVEMKPGKGAQIARGAGIGAQILAHEGGYVTLRLRSGETRKILDRCRATVGVVSNSEHSLRSLGKAGARRWRGVRPTVRGVVMNPVDHPHGGGEGRSSGGRHPSTPWGRPTKGHKTRRRKSSDALIVRRRRVKK